MRQRILLNSWMCVGKTYFELERKLDYQTQNTDVFWNDLIKLHFRNLKATNETRDLSALATHPIFCPTT